MLKGTLRARRSVLLVGIAALAVTVTCVGVAFGATPLKTGQTVYYIPKDTLNPY